MNHNWTTEGSTQVKRGLQVIDRHGSVRAVEDPEEALPILRHSTAHLMAAAVRQLFPDVHLGIGPATSEGFYYDFQVDHPFSEEDLERIEEKMRELCRLDLPFEPSILSKEEALQLFEAMGEKLKLELLGEKVDEVLSCYRLGDFVDFCTGPHVRSTGELGVFKLLSVAGSYWRGDEKREQLQRIYGTAFFTEEELKEYLERLEEAKRRDHRRLGRELGLFSIEDQVAPGLVFWHPHGAIVRTEVEKFLREMLEAAGYQFVYTPHIARSDLWRTSGHYDYFRQNMFVLPVEDEEYVLKPMNCPGHILVYQSSLRSYRDLPIRLAEFGTVYRYEKSGTLHGMLRVRGFTQDDAHIFCRPDQVKDEVQATLDLAQKILHAFGFDEFKVTLSVWDPEKSQDYAGSAAEWERAEAALREVLETRGWSYDRAEGEAAFYGPKIDVQLVDALGRSWQLSTFQFDFNLPRRFDITYMGDDSKPHHVVMIHRALLGSLERFMGVLIEHYAGAFPVWLAPIQVSVIPVSEKFFEYGQRVAAELKRGGLRVELDDRNEKVGYKIRSAEVRKIPYMLVVGQREASSETVSVRERQTGDLGSRSVQEFLAQVQDLIAKRALTA